MRRKDARVCWRTRWAAFWTPSGMWVADESEKPLAAPANDARAVTAGGIGGTGRKSA